MLKKCTSSSKESLNASIMAMMNYLLTCPSCTYQSWATLAITKYWSHWSLILSWKLSSKKSKFKNQMLFSCASKKKIWLIFVIYSHRPKRISPELLWREDKNSWFSRKSILRSTGIREGCHLFWILIKKRRELIYLSTLKSRFLQNRWLWFKSWRSIL